MPDRIRLGPTTSLRFVADDGTSTDLTPFLAVPPPERGVPYSVSWYDREGHLWRADRVYVIPPPFSTDTTWALLDALSGAQLMVPLEAMPTFRAPTKPHPHRVALAAEWGKRVSPRRVLNLDRQR